MTRSNLTRMRVMLRLLMFSPRSQWPEATGRGSMVGGATTDPGAAAAASAVPAIAVATPIAAVKNPLRSIVLTVSFLNVGQSMLALVRPCPLLYYETNESVENPPPKTGVYATPSQRSSSVAYTD